jgi:hypothetical protein
MFYAFSLLLIGKIGESRKTKKKRAFNLLPGMRAAESMVFGISKSANGTDSAINRSWKIDRFWPT